MVYLLAQAFPQRRDHGFNIPVGTTERLRNGFIHDAEVFQNAGRNPHGFGSADHLAWENGWCEALDEEEGSGLSPLTGTRRDAN